MKPNKRVSLSSSFFFFILNREIQLFSTSILSLYTSKNLLFMSSKVAHIQPYYSQIVKKKIICNLVAVCEEKKIVE